MTTEKLYRVIWRMEEMKPFEEPDIYLNRQLDIAIMEECGCSDRTLRDIKKQMRKLGLIASNGLGTWRIDKSHTKSISGYGEKQTELGTPVVVLSAYPPANPTSNLPF